MTHVTENAVVRPSALHPNAVSMEVYSLWIENQPQIKTETPPNANPLG